MKTPKLFLCAALFLTLSLVYPAKAQARDDYGLGALAIALAVGTVVVATHLPFVVYDIVVASQNELPSTAWAVTEVSVTGPPVLFLNGLHARFLGNASFPDWPSVAVLGALTIQPTHGVLALAQDDLSPRALYGLSAATGMNFVLTTTAIGTALGQRRLNRRSVGILEVTMTAPQVGVFLYESISNPQFRPLWIGYTAWSGALLLHGAASIIWGSRRDMDDSTSALLPQPSKQLPFQAWHGGIVPLRDRGRGHGALFTLGAIF